MPVGQDGLARLPAAAVAGLHAAFRAEVTERLPRLEQVGPGSSPELLAEALRDAHNLGSSAAVLGEPDASRVARALEADLHEGDLDGVPAAVQQLGELLSQWRDAP